MSLNLLSASNVEDYENIYKSHSSGDSKDERQVKESHYQISNEYIIKKELNSTQE